MGGRGKKIYERQQSKGWCVENEKKKKYKSPKDDTWQMAEMVTRAQEGKKFYI